VRYNTGAKYLSTISAIVLLILSHQKNSNPFTRFHHAFLLDDDHVDDLEEADPSSVSLMLVSVVDLADDNNGEFRTAFRDSVPRPKLDIKDAVGVQHWLRRTADVTINPATDGEDD
jgi:hypothetical protein